MQQPVTVAIAGIVSFGRTFVNRLLDEADGKGVRLVGAIARRPERCTRLQELVDAGARVCPTIEDFYADGGKADLVIVSTPIHIHRAQTETALRHGSHVLCEKPVAATVQDALAMGRAEKAAGRFVAIGYQWSFVDAVQALKRDVMDGVLGRPVRLRALVCWPRTTSYYTGRGWAAVLKNGDGAWILDSPVHNAMAHFLHNAFYVLGKDVATAAQPAEVQCEAYRANAIENFDTMTLRVRTTEGAEILLYGSHAVQADLGPILSYEFENASVYYERNGGDGFVARFRDGRLKRYGDPEDEGRAKVWQSVEAARTGASPVCGIAASLPQVIAANGAQESAGGAVTIPADRIRRTGDAEDPLVCVPGLDALLTQCFAQGCLLSEHGGVDWARPARTVDLRDYRHYPCTEGTTTS